MNGWEIKRKLKQRFPRAQFRVQIEHFSGGSCVNVYTNIVMLQEERDEMSTLYFKVTRGEANPEERERYYQLKEKWEKTKEIERIIRDLAGENIHYDQFGDILLGGNRFVHVYPYLPKNKNGGQK
jgi:hypothetical protein